MSTNRKSIKALGSNRVIFLTGEITEINTVETARRLLELDKQSNKDILLIINSDGGDLASGLFLTNIFKIVKSNIAILVPAAAHSTATIILASGTKGMRIVMPGAVAMMHGSIYALPDNPHKVQKSDVDFQEKREHFFANYLADRGYSKPEHSLASEYYYYTGQEIIDVGLADILINSLEELYKVVKI